MADRRVFGWLADTQGCGHYRMIWPLQQVARHGWDVTGVSEQLRPDVIDDRNCVIVGQRVWLPEPTLLWLTLAHHGRTLVYELDDNLLDVPADNEAAAMYMTREAQDRIRACLRVSTEVWVSTEALAAVVRPFNERVRVLQNRIPARLLDRPMPDSSAPVTVGWAGSATHRADFAECEHQVRRFLTRNPDVRWHTIGADYLRWPGGRHTPWVDDVEGFHDRIDFDIGLAPLRPSVFNRSKSAVRALELAALGVPVIASDTGPYTGAVQDGRTGFLVRREHEWGQRLRQLADDPALRQRMSEVAREWARGHTYEDNGRAWVDALEAVRRNETDVAAVSGYAALDCRR